MKKVKYLEVKQPIGSFYICSLKATTLANISEINSRTNSPISVQRDHSRSRVKEITEYCSDSDATFPTSIILAVNLNSNVRIDENFIYFSENEVVGEIVDGQHRLRGLIESKHIDEFEVPVVFMFDLLPSQKAYIFSIINSKQTKVSMSLIYDLFALSENRSPYKTCHEIARALNKEPYSPFYQRLKMLGRKEKSQEHASLSQGTFIKKTLELISKKPDDDTRRIKDNKSLLDDESIPLRHYFIEERDDVIHKIILNLFRAVSIVFEEEWNNPKEFILSKSTGFSAILKVFPFLYDLGRSCGQLNEAFFIEHFEEVRRNFRKLNIKLTSDHYGSNDQAINKLANQIRNSCIPSNGITSKSR